MLEWISENQEWLFSGLGIFLLGVVGALITTWNNRRILRLLVHTACFNNSLELFYFINITNTSRIREIEITHIYFDCNPQIPVLQPDRPLPKRLIRDETWETFISINKLPENIQSNTYNLVRARLSNGRIIKSKKNKNVPHSGIVPGGSINTLE